jgi:hypothetical protein
MHAVLLGGSSARLIGASAAVFHGLADPRLPIQLAVDWTSGLASRRWMTVVRQRPEARPSRFLASPPRTVVEDTVLDMCASAANEAAVIGFLTLSIPRLTSPGKLRRALERRARIAHRLLISDILAETANGVQSPLEYRWIEQVERPHRLPVPTRRVSGATPTRLHRPTGSMHTLPELSVSFLPMSGERTHVVSS